MGKVLKLIKELQAELMVSKELPHIVSVHLLARLDEAERHLPLNIAPAKADVGAELDGGLGEAETDKILE